MIKFVQIISLLIMARILFPVFSYCPFRLPFLYCFICPLRCVWYQARGLVLLALVGLNLKNEFFCNYLCPFGAAQQLLYKVSPGKLSLPAGLANFKYISLILVILIIVVTKWPQTFGFNFFLRLKVPLFLTFLFSILLSIFNYRFFCYQLCPIKAVSILSDKIRLR